MVPGAGAAEETAAATLTLAERRAVQLAANKLAGQAFEDRVGAWLAARVVEVGDQVTVVTASGARTRLDFLFRDPATGAIRCIEAKSSATAPLTANQEAAFAEIRQSGATIVGAGKPGFAGGTRIPPTEIEMVFPDNLDDLNFGGPP